jgi:phosphatidylserine/phosphatidylglycerophosphate/cardiolipin synthase-like enzyme
MVETIIGRQFPDKVIPLINEAKSSISIIVFDWRWYSNDPGASAQLFNQAILRAVRRGVCVKAIVNSPDILNTLNSQGCQAKKLSIKNLVHCKLMIIDNEVVVVGSHNYTQNAFQMNYEFSVILRDVENISDFFNFFDNLWQS